MAAAGGGVGGVGVRYRAMMRSKTSWSRYGEREGGVIPEARRAMALGKMFPAALPTGLLPADVATEEAAAASSPVPRRSCREE